MFKFPPPAPVVCARSNDLSYVVALQKKHHQALGFLPRVALEQKIELGRIWLATENDEPAGFLHHGSLARPEVRIFQAAIQYDAQRRHLGFALVNDLIARARAAGAEAISLRCLSFLEANAFWSAAGFHLLAQEPGAKGTLNVWGMKLIREEPGRIIIPGDVEEAGAAKASFAFHSRLHPCPRCGVTTMDTWKRGARRHGLCAACVAVRRDL